MLRQRADAIEKAAVHLYAPRAAVLAGGGGFGTPRGAGKNPPYGAVINFRLAAAPDTATTLLLEFLDAKNTVVRSFATKGDTVNKLTVKPGLNAFNWNLRRAAPARLAGVLLFGVEHGILLGVVLSLATLVWRSSRPHMAVVGRVPGTEHYRNIERYQVQTQPGLIALRIDESLYFANAQGLEDRIESLTRAQPDTRCVLLIMSAVNQLDTTALEMLTELELSLAARGIVLQLAEIKGPMLDRLRATSLGQRMQHRIFLSTHQAFVAFGDREALNTHSA
jgi:SulP family sulfate permease